MKPFLPLTLALLIVALAGSTGLAFEGYSMPSASWHAGYYDPAWGVPHALVVPPTAEMQTQWGWGVGNTRIVPLSHQFQRDYPGPLFYDSRTFQPIPRWPSHTEQFGVYYIRGPW